MVVEKNGLVRIEVMDTGLGFSSFQKVGVGIGNVRERIRLLYGEKGRLILEENKPNGVRARRRQTTSRPKINILWL